MRSTNYTFWRFVTVAALVVIFIVLWESKGSLKNIESHTEEFVSWILPERIITPEPLRYLGKAHPSSRLTKEGVLLYTNNERAKEGLNELTQSSPLDVAAEEKVDDMFAGKYFAHVSPQGLAVSDFAKKVGYEYIIIGENLAQGNFKDDSELVRAWMDSPGHRANIMNQNYKEIGISVKKGEFEGEQVWLGVQIFANPSSSCARPDKEIKRKIASTEKELQVIEMEIKQKKESIESYKPKRGAEYNAKIDEYNILVSQYNEILRALREVVEEFNESVRVYNECVAQNA
ncbi:MAG: hypothetical protein A3G52_00190 [Candidatus Taylorbacteria bacterium RIFCSPLOWO2_12_FULL_43_20]|uniref:SCP domain-containing protein n=1 Tax=Candidatus Taylorbacteria bacterium RIFCSPLOWO2_12_FULL_43_20 TaxID=1802332 RepID=A0A1G2P3G1_9BACT|nr:MAG: hypothetical protein A2825_01585 [Candidatus Taylorbacteria bacterium RIFCSPHIGHO2_01_FULL_43_120]OHA23114.1 MAG: hypothetical protein A3B98_03620 [Candidatus Taylorbacteria bacterium RIFCSPHIGHO2_02_FULL_43_55]OHA28905.1 MAG: hypothetical protein A3E92_04510 [Candidatus Taylorbacteria bacterium RIFCSPHIGHO2_12_FULL_42_34]OHA30889.1 MAG: hypothetical protein A3B09_04460 [Candidatus Taylorbacteria bacterium RIFCSPLOWO2_01_FULL_43_83]OHA39317.1 MAG: hypothetical protein A3H58_04000 [Candi